jgi:hypothetical protein
MAVEVCKHNLSNWKMQKSPQLMDFDFALDFKIFRSSSSEVHCSGYRI